MVELFANSADPDQTPCSVTLLGVSRLQWADMSEIYRFVFCYI